jgi:heptosyltransferase-2
MEKDKNFAQEVISLTKTRPADFTGKTKIMELAVLIKRCKVFITPDSAPMHIAAAMHVPFIVFFGPTASTRHLPPAESCLVLEKELECQPCYSSTCRISTHACMRDIMPEEIAGHVVQLIKEKV